MSRFYSIAYYLCMTTGMILAAVILADRLDFIFSNPVVQLSGVCGGIAILFWLSKTERGRME